MARKTAPRARRAKGEGALFQRGDGRWVGAVELGLDANGERVRRTVTSKDHAKVIAEMQKLKDANTRGEVPTGITVRDWLTRWQASETFAAYSANTRRVYSSDIKAHLIPILGHLALSSLTASHIETMFGEMRRRTAGNPRPAGGGAMRSAKGTLSAALRVAVRDRLISHNPAHLAVIPAGPVEHHAHVEADGARKLLAYLDTLGAAGDWHRSSRFAAALLTGIRQGEALALRWDDVHLDGPAPSLFIHASAGYNPVDARGEGMQVGPTKTRTSVRSVHLAPPLAHALRELRKQTGGRGFVWGYDGGARPMPSTTDRGRWSRVCQRAGVPLVPLHGARSTFASMLLAAGTPEVTISHILGHASVQITQAAYLRTNAAQHASAITAGYAALMSAGADVEAVPGEVVGD